MPSDYIRSIPIIVGAEIFNTAYVTPNNIYTTAIAPLNTPTIFEIWLSMNAAGSLTVKRTNNGITVSEIPGVAQSLNANDEVAFEIRVHAGDTINFTFSANCTINSFSVAELDSELA